jgi:hypothetical protein
VVDRVPFNGSGFGVLLKPEPYPNPMFATRNFWENFQILFFVFRTLVLYYNEGISLLRLLRIAIGGGKQQ